MQLITILAIQICLIFVGVLAGIAMGAKKKTEVLGLSYLLGSGIVTMLFLLLHWFLNLKLNQTTFLLSIGLSVAGFSSIALGLKRLKNIKTLFPLNLTKWVKNLTRIEKYTFIVILLLVSFSVFENYFWPIIDWDALAFYDFRAKVMALNGDMFEGIQLKYFFQYPPYTSFLHVFGYSFEAERVKIVYSLIYSSLLLSFYSLLRRKQIRLVGLFFTLLLSSIPMIFEHSIMAYSNLSFVSFFSIGIIYLWLYFEKGLTKDLLIGGLLIGLSTWVRSTEPFWIAGAALILISAIKHKSNLIPSTLLLIFLNLPSKIWRSFIIDLESTSSIKTIDSTSHTTDAIVDFLAQNQSFWSVLVRIFEVFKYLIVTLFPEFSLLIMLLILTIIVNHKDKRVEIFSLIILMGIVFAGTLIFSFTFETWDVIGGSIIRMCMIFIPLVLYVIAKDLKYERKN